MSENSEFQKAIGKFVIEWSKLLSLISVDVLVAFYFTKLWKWFVIPVFHTVELTLLGSLGLIYLKCLLFFSRGREETKAGGEGQIVTDVVVVTLIFFFAWILHFLV